MDTPQPTVPVRTVNRIFVNRTISAVGAMADILGLDLIDLLIFTGVWSANTAHLSAGRYDSLFALPPDSRRMPVTVAMLAKTLRLSRDLTEDRVAGLVARDIIEQTPAGLVVPSAVLAQPKMLEALERNYRDVRDLVSACVEAERGQA